METLKSTEAEEGLTATLTLLSMGIKSVPQAVLRRQFSDSASVFVDILEKHATSENGTVPFYFYPIVANPQRKGNCRIVIAFVRVVLWIVGKCIRTLLY